MDLAAELHVFCCCIAGKLASHICHCCEQRGWIQRRATSRAVDITPPGRKALQAWLGLQHWTACG